VRDRRATLPLDLECDRRVRLEVAVPVRRAASGEQIRTVVVTDEPDLDPVRAVVK
jgi:hypothetical protein